MERRDVFKILSAATMADTALGQHGNHGKRGVPANYKPRFFTPSEYELLDTLCETILPADEDGGGARAAGVPFYIDTIVLHSDGGTKHNWRDGMAAMAAHVNSQGGVENALKDLVTREASPESLLERFFVRLKVTTIEGFFQSDMGLKFLGHKGNGAKLTFQGCNHPEHQA